MNLYRVMLSVTDERPLVRLELQRRFGPLVEGVILTFVAKSESAVRRQLHDAFSAFIEFEAKVENLGKVDQRDKQ